MAGTSAHSQHRDHRRHTPYPLRVTTPTSLFLLLFAPFAGSFLGTIARRLRISQRPVKKPVISKFQNLVREPHYHSETGGRVPPGGWGSGLWGR